tara:strand:- start:2633 stop:7216 length:4584 start_codon:yes stop_codon:yes gene_type:complete
MLPLSDKFKNSFDGKHNSVFPIVVISQYGTFLQNDNLVYLSQNAKYFNFFGIGENQYFEDFGLNVSDISENIDVFDRSFQTNSIKVSVSNYVIKNKRFSERFNTEFTGHKCRIYYANFGITDISDCPIVFEGYIRNYSINHESCQFDIEDESQYLQDSNSFPKRKTQNSNAETIDTNKWLYFPVVYGENERSRLLFSRPQINNLISKIFPDANYEDSEINILGFSSIDNTLKILRDGMYLDVPRIFQEVPEDLVINGYRYSNYIGKDQYEIIDQQIVLEKNISDHAFTNGMPLNIQARDQFQIDASRPATGVKATDTDNILTYGNANDGDGDIQEIEYQGPLNGYGLSSGGGEFFFPTPDDDDQLDYAGYYENQLVSKFVRRFRFGNGIGSSRDYWDSGSFYILDKALSQSVEYEAEGTPGAYELYKNVPEDANSLIKFFNLPGRNNEWEAKYIYCWIGSGVERTYKISIFQDGSTVGQWVDGYQYPSSGLADSGIGPVKFKQPTHPSLVFNIDTLGTGNLYNNHSPLGQGYYRNMGISFKRVSVASNLEEQIPIGVTYRFLWDNPIDYDAEQQALQDLYSESFNIPEGYDLAINQDALPTAPPIVFREGINGTDSETIAQTTLQLGGSWTNSDGDQMSYIRQFPDGENHQSFGLMDWNKDESGSWIETPTLRKLLFGRRLEEDEYIDTNIPLGSWVYGLIPVLGYCKPKTSTLRSEDDSSGGNYFYKISQDALYAYLNPMLECVGVMDNDSSLTNSGQDAGLTNNIVDYTTRPSIFDFNFDVFAYSSAVSAWRRSNLEAYYNWLNQGSDLSLLKSYNVQSTPDEPNSFYQGSFQVGIHKNNFGSDFGPIYGRLNYHHTGNQIPIHSRIEYSGIKAFRGGNYVPIAYTQGQKKAAKLDITFNSISGNDVVQGSNYARLVLNMSVDLYLRYIDQTSDNNAYNVDFLVECDAFKNDEGRNNVIEVKKINANLDPTTIDEETNEPTVLYKYRTGHPESQPVDENGDLIYEIGTLATSADLETDPIDPYTIKSRCDFFEPEAGDQNQEDTWMENINSVNNVSLTYHIGQDPKKSDFSDNGDNINGEYLNHTISQAVDGGILTQIHKAEIQQRFIVGNVSQQEYFAHVKGRIDDWVIISDAPSDDLDESGNQIIWVEGKYTGKNLNLNSVNEDWLITNPADVLMHLIDKEFDYSLPETDQSSIVAARENHENWQFDFTISKETDPVEFLEDYCKSTMFCARMRYDGTFSYINLFRNINESDKIINSSDIINFKITKTPKEKLFLKVRVSYDYDEGLDSYLKSTNIDGGGIVPSNIQDFLQSYSVKDVNSHYLDFKSKFIKNADTAEKLRNRLLSYYKNRHNVFNITLPHSYLDLECGDIVEFSDLIQGVQIFGLDYTQDNTVNGQIALKYFVVTEVVKSVDSLQVKLLQQHLYDENFIEDNPTYNFLYNVEDSEAVSEDPEDSSEDSTDFDFDFLPGDVNFDGLVDVLDVVQIINQVISQESALTNSDYNQDGATNILDVVSMVNQIIDSGD